MNRYFLIGLSLIFISLASCSKRELELDEADPTMVKAITESLIEASATSKSEKEVLWEPGDEIAVFSGELSGKFVSTLKKKPSAAAVFKGDLGLESWPEEMDIWAVYPYSEEAFFDGETITTTLPSEQIAKDGMFGKDMNLAIAHSNTSTLQFYNVGGGIRFSVTEEGIKKVIFEGLGGEIISGKVKIGFDKDGLPEIQKITKGSPFITLLPPEGQETFEKDTWYYIVAIPGSLEKGYKLRFYKDNDYARKVSNNAMIIKRSFYRDMAEADEEIEYEATTTHFPESKSEWIESIELTRSIGNIARNIIDSLRGSNLPAINYGILRDIEGVLDVLVDTENDLVAIMQKDSVVINYPNPRIFLHSPCSLDQEYQTIASTVSTSNYPKELKKSSSSTSSGLHEKKALILIPCETPGNYYEYHNKYIRNCLIEMGYDSDNIVSKLGPDADITSFKGDELSKYDYIHITSHGSTGYTAFQPKSGIKRAGNCFASATEYSASWAVLNLATKEIDWDNIAMFYCDNSFDNNDDPKYYLCMTSDFLKNASFDKTCVLVTACHSAATINGVVGGTVLSEFVRKGAGIASGYRITATGDYSEPFARFVTKLLSHGIPFQDAVTYLGNSTWFNHYLYYHCVEKLRIDLTQEKITAKEYENELKLISHDNFFYCPPPEVSSQPYYLHKLSISLNDNVSVSDGTASLGWEFDYVPFIESFSYKDYSTYETHKDIIPFTVHYEVHIDDDIVLTPEVSYEKSVQWVSPSTGPHDWHVIAKIMEGDTVITSYQSDEGRFYVTGEIITVESVSLDKSNLELNVGNTATLNVTILPENATNKNVTWSSSNTSVATVSSTGEVKGIAKGTATITVKTEDGGKTATCKVTVKETTMGGDIEGTEEDPWN